MGYIGLYRGQKEVECTIEGLGIEGNEGLYYRGGKKEGLHSLVPY